MKDIFLSYDRSSDRFVAEIKRALAGLEAGKIGTIYEEQIDSPDKEGWQQANDQIRDAIVVVLLSNEWFQHKVWELRLTLHHQRQYVIVQCHPDVTVPTTLPEKLKTLLNQPNWVSLFDKDGKVDFDQRDELLKKVREYVDAKRPPSTARKYHKDSWGDYVWRKSEWLEKLWERKPVRYGALALIAVIAIVVFGYQINLNSILPSFLVTPTPSPLPTSTPVLPLTLSYPLNTGECLAYFEGSDPRYVINLLCGDTSGSPTPALLTREGYDSSFPAWSCDGNKLAYTSNDNAERNFDINIYNISDSSKQRLQTDEVAEGMVALSPSGDDIAYAAKLPGEDDFEIYILNSQSMDVRRVTDNNVDDLMPDWSCAHGLLVFESGAGDTIGGVDLYVNDLQSSYDNGTGENLTAQNSWRTRSPAWSCDGRQIAYHASPDRNTDAEIFIMDADGSNNMQLTNDSLNEFAPSWSPDGTRLVFHSNGTTSGTSDLFILNIATRQITARLTEGLSVNDRSPVWQPRSDCS